MGKIEDLFAKASGNIQGYYTEAEWMNIRRHTGVLNFKKQASLNCFRGNVEKTLDEMAQILYDTGMASSIEEGKALTPQLVGNRFSSSSMAGIEIEEIGNHEDNKKYRISSYEYQC
jgi:hypothetical protein